MAPFIKFTERIEETGGCARNLRFINASMIRTALYIESSGELQITLIEGGNKVDFRLQGEEAKAALKILQEL